MPKFATVDQIDTLNSYVQEVRSLMIPVGRVAITNFLTANELKHVDLASQGMTKTEASEVCSLSESTVKNVRNSALHKAGARSISQLVRMAVEDEAFDGKLGPSEQDSSLSPLMVTELEFISLGLTSDEVSRLRGVSERTTRHIRGSIYARMGAKNAPHAVRLGMEAGIIGVTISND